MNDAIAKGLESALRAAADSDAFAGIENGGGSARDLINLAIKALPKFLEKLEAREDFVELEKEGLSELHKETHLLRRQLRELVKSQKAVIEELSLMRELQSTMVSHLARVQILEMPDDEDIDDEYGFVDDLIAPAGQRSGGGHGANRMKTNGRRHTRLR